MSDRDRFLKRWAALKLARSTWDSHWQELAEYILPRRIKKTTSEQNRGTKRNEKIINDTATRAARVSSAGMMAAMCSPARLWLRYATPDPDQMEAEGVRDWLHTAQRRTLYAFATSNFYDVIAPYFLDLVVFGTAPMILDEDDTDVIRGYLVPVGSYALQAGPRGQIDTLYREGRLTVAQVVERFGTAGCSNRVRDAYDRSKYDDPVDILHVIEPNRERDDRAMDYRGMPWKSCWLEQANENPNAMLHTAGYREFPVCATRWSISGDDVYGSSPGMDCLGDVKALQKLESKKLKIVDKLADPPMNGDPLLEQNGGGSLLPGAMNYAGKDGFVPAYTPPPAGLTATADEIGKHAERIMDTFNARLWLMNALREGGQPPTAEQIRAEQQEMKLQLGPNAQRVNREGLQPAARRTLAILMRRSLPYWRGALSGVPDLPPPPPELQGVEPQVDILDMFAQAQRAQDLIGAQDVVATAVRLAAETQRMDLLDKVDFDEFIDQMADRLDVSPDVVLSDERVAAIRAARQRAAEAAQMAAAVPDMARTAQALGNTPMDGDSALSRLLQTAGVA